jgi:hypothetical protein
LLATPSHGERPAGCAEEAWSRRVPVVFLTGQSSLSGPSDAARHAVLAGVAPGRPGAVSPDHGAQPVTQAGSR